MPSGGEILRELGIPWPAANEDDLRAAAATWSSLAEVIRTNSGSANSAASGLSSSNEGAAIEAFQTYWARFGAQGKGLMPLGAQACDAMSTACGKYADAVAQAKRKIEEAGVEVAATLTLGAIGAFFTFGATEAAADGIAAGLIDTVNGIFTELDVLTGGITSVLSDGVFDALSTELAASITTTAVTGAATGTGGTLFGIAAANSVRDLFGDKPLSSSESALDLLEGFGGGALTGGLGSLGEMTAEQLSNVMRNAATSVATSNPQLFMQMMSTSSLLAGTTGKVAAGVLSTATTQLIMSQKLDAQGITSDQIEDLLERLAGG